MIFSAQLAGSQWHAVGDEIWQEPLADAIRAEADMIAGYAGTHLLNAALRDALRERIISEMTAALVCAGDIYRAPDGVVYALHDDVESATGDHADTLPDVSSELEDPIVEQVLQWPANGRGQQPEKGPCRSRPSPLLKEEPDERSSDGATAARAPRSAGTQTNSYPQSTTSGGSEGVVERGECRVMSMFMTSNPRRAIKPSTGY